MPPSSDEPATEVQEWWLAEYRRFSLRWPSLFRGDFRSRTEAKLSDEDIANDHLVLWGLPTTNPLLAALLKHPKNPLPVKWDFERLVVNGKTYDAKHHVLAMIYPNPLNPKKYVVLNSGPTFREGHDHTNSQQTPKLPDWAVIERPHAGGCSPAGQGGGCRILR